MNPVGSHATGSSDAAAAALKGASLAFNQKKSSSSAAAGATIPASSSAGSLQQRRDNGALVAATTAGRSASVGVGNGNGPGGHHHHHGHNYQGQQPASIGPQLTGSSAVSDLTSEGPARHQQHQHGPGFLAAKQSVSSFGQLHPPDMPGGPQSRVVDTKSPSFIAATLAASRSASPSPKARSPRRVGSANGLGAFGGPSSPAAEGVDSESIAPTTSLISMFERDRAEEEKEQQRIRQETDRARAKAAAMRAEPARVHKKVLSMDTSAAMGRGAASAQRPLEESTSEKRNSLVSKGVKDLSISPDRAGEKPPKPSTKSKPQPPKATAQNVSSESQRYSGEQHDDGLPKHSGSLGRRAQPAPSITRYGLPNTVDQHITATKEDASATAMKAPASRSKPEPVPVPPKPDKIARAVTKTNDEDMPVAREPATPSKPRVKPKPVPLTPVISRSSPPLVSPRPIRVTKPPNLQPLTPEAVGSPHRELAVVSPPSRDPQKKRVSQIRPPTPPQPRGSSSKTSGSPAARSAGERRPSAAVIAKATRRDSVGVPGRTDTITSASSDDTFVSASSIQSPRRLSPPPSVAPRWEVAVSAPDSPRRGTPRYQLHAKNASTSNLPLNSLTNAIVAGSLASARLTPQNTGSSLPPPPLPRRQKSPRMVQTLRQPVSLSDDEADRQKSDKHLRHRQHRNKLRSGRHALHEGSRKRWREQMTERERKRYEAVWASNRGLLLLPGNESSRDDGDMSKYVSNVVVRDLWRRSRLPDDELSEVWELVDRQHRGVLGREEFAVGMWLIDQRLRGRKIPMKVSDSLWGSVNGFKVKRPKV